MKDQIGAVSFARVKDLRVDRRFQKSAALQHVLDGDGTAIHPSRLSTSPVRILISRCARVRRSSNLRSGCCQSGNGSKDETSARHPCAGVASTCTSRSSASRTKHAPSPAPADIRGCPTFTGISSSSSSVLKGTSVSNRMAPIVDPCSSVCPCAGTARIAIRKHAASAARLHPSHRPSSASKSCAQSMMMTASPSWCPA